MIIFWLQIFSVFEFGKSINSRFVLLVATWKFEYCFFGRDLSIIQSLRCFIEVYGDSGKVKQGWNWSFFKNKSNHDCVIDRSTITSLSSCAFTSKSFREPQYTKICQPCNKWINISHLTEDALIFRYTLFNSKHEKWSSIYYFDQFFFKLPTVEFQI